MSSLTSTASLAARAIFSIDGKMQKQQASAQATRIIDKAMGFSAVESLKS
jgi:hypothetical protein